MHELREKRRQEASQIGSFEDYRSRGRALNKLTRALPKSQERAKEVMKLYAKKFKVELDTTHEKELTDIEKRGFEFFKDPVIAYTAPGTRDQMVIRNNKGEKENVRKYYLMVFLREAYKLFVMKELNESPENFDFDPEKQKTVMNFTKFTTLRPPNVLLQKDTKNDACICILHENFIFLIKALGVKYDSEFWTQILCNDRFGSYCWLSCCNDCIALAKLVPEKSPDTLVQLDQWKKVANSKLLKFQTPNSKF